MKRFWVAKRKGHMAGVWIWDIKQGRKDYCSCNDEMM